MAEESRVGRSGALLYRIGRCLPWLFVVALVEGCASLPPPIERTPTFALEADPHAALTQVARASLATSAPSAVRAMPQSIYSMNARLTLVRHAQRSLDLQYYLLQNDVTGHTLLRAVRDAATRGVRVRILVDDLYTDESDQMLLALSAYPNIEVRLFNPFPAGRGFQATRWLFAASDFARVNHRMHNKMLIADNALAVAGGRNIANEYFFHSTEGNFVDFDLLVAGAAVPEMSAIFDEYWNSPRVYPLHALETSSLPAAELQARFEAISSDAKEAFPDPPANEPDLLGYEPLWTDILHPPLKMIPTSIKVFADDPEKVSGRAESGQDPTTVTSKVIAAIGEAHHEVTLGSPYFIPGKIGLAGLEQARAAGVHIEALTNSLASNDEPLATAAYAQYRVPMLKAGIDLYETDSSQMKNNPLLSTALRASIGRSHSKLIVIDHHITFVGSMNLDFRSSRLNTELGLLVDSRELASQVYAMVDLIRNSASYHLRLDAHDHLQWVGTENGREVVYDSDPRVDFGTELQIWLLFPFVNQDLL